MSLQDPPRMISPSALIGAMFGGLTQQILWGALAFASLFFWLMAADALQVQLQYNEHLHGPLARTQGVITAVEDTNAEENESDVLAHQFKYSVAGEDYKATSYANEEHELETGQKVTVEYRQDQPSIARIRREGFRASVFSWWVLLFMLAFGGLLLLAVCYNLLQGCKAVLLMVYGNATSAKLLDQTPTGQVVQINNDKYPVYALRFGYRVNGVSYTTTVKTHETDALTDDAREILLYWPSRPQLALPVDAIQGEIYLNDAGSFDSYKAESAQLYLLAPVLTIGLNGWLVGVYYF